MDSVNESLEDLINYEEDRNRSARVRRSECPGGSGKFGFNSYNLLAFLLMSFNQVSNVIVNTNNNRNNNNNNDFQATYGSINTNQQSSEATQTGSTMTMITVPPTGTPIVVPIGRLLSNGRILLNAGVKEKGVVWDSPGWTLTDSGVIFYKDNSSAPQTGVQYFGTVDSSNVFQPFSGEESPVTLEQVRALDISNRTRTGREPQILEVSGSPVLVKETDLEILHRRLIERTGKRLVGVFLPPAGPAVTMSLGWLLPGGEISLLPGLEVEGVYWENVDRKIFTNGTIEYKGTRVVETATVIIGTVDTEGKINTLPRVENTIIDFSLLRSLNINKPRRTRRSLNLLNYTNFKTLISAIFNLESELCQRILLCEVETMLRQELNTPTRTESGKSSLNTLTRTESGKSKTNTPTRTESAKSSLNTPTRTESGKSRLNTPTRTESGESRINIPTRTESGESRINTPTRSESGESRINTPTRSESGESRINDLTRLESKKSLMESCKEIKNLRTLKHIDCRWHILN
ncbi:uncharacterized protein LOC111700212 [Eurytemora carolleeae]|uniref:uncharacterized protein LOC111700212 n=1 Tax=Eurytemora carolleeae TaxID=1294199 RepID=UPI000C76CCF4|nr:uncharacterized protein LOC111700212 [Eurytemora carolleeae]|eukprot:XP_023326847.1 uncharacterized protein LOC111700212 [Eurytemora affinis]